MRYLILFTLLAAPAIAQEADDLSCSGQDPDWALEISNNIATLDFLRTSDMTLQLVTQAQGQEWPKAYTFIGRGDTAIVLLEESIDDGTNPARILTQRGETPLLLVGECSLD